MEQKILTAEGYQADCILKQSGKHTSLFVNGGRIPIKSIQYSQNEDSNPTISIEFYPTTLDLQTDQPECVEIDVDGDDE